MYGGGLTNLASGTINLAAGSSANDEGGLPCLENDGQFNVSGPRACYIGIPFNNHGTVTVNGGALNLEGTTSLTKGTLNFVITNPANFGTLNLPGNAVLTCALGASFSGYTPRMGDSFGLITYGSETGIFSAFNLPPDANWKFDYGQTAFTLSVASLTGPYLTLQVIEPPLNSNNFTMLMLGPIGSNYMIQASSNPSFTNWVSLTNFTSVDTSFYYTDTTATNHESRIFRAVMH
jgi:hypothetical protein